MALGLSASLVVAATPAGADRHEGIMPGGHWTDDQIDYALDLVERTHQQLPTFDLTESELQAMGYVDFGPAPDGYDHWMNVDLLDDEHILDPAFPESLVFYEDWQTGERRLVAAMYMLGTDDTFDTIPHDIAWLPGWHTHPDVCWDLSQGGIFTGLTSGGSCSSGEPIHIPMTHVWLEDPGCGHLFGGVDIGGLHCGSHDPGHPPTTEPPHDPGHPPTTEPPHDPGHPPTTEPPHDPGHPPTSAPLSSDPAHTPPAEPVAARPSFTG